MYQADCVHPDKLRYRLCSLEPAMAHPQPCRPHVVPCELVLTTNLLELQSTGSFIHLVPYQQVLVRHLSPSQCGLDCSCTKTSRSLQINSLVILPQTYRKPSTETARGEPPIGPGTVLLLCDDQCQQTPLRCNPPNSVSSVGSRTTCIVPLICLIRLVSPVILPRNRVFSYKTILRQRSIPVCTSNSNSSTG